MVTVYQVVLVDCFVEDYQRRTDEEMSDVVCKEFVHAYIY